MARPKRTKELKTTEKIENIVNQISTVEYEISVTEERLSMLRNDKQDLENQLHKEKINLLLETMEEKNISLDRAKEIIDNMEG